MCVCVCTYMSFSESEMAPCALVLDLNDVFLARRAGKRRSDEVTGSCIERDKAEWLMNTMELDNHDLCTVFVIVFL